MFFDLADDYSGGAHGLTNPKLEDTTLAFSIENRQSNGKFNAIFGLATFPGKVTSRGKMTFSGGVIEEKTNTEAKVKASGQLSVTGHFAFVSDTQRRQIPALLRASVR